MEGRLGNRFRRRHVCLTNLLLVRRIRLPASFPSYPAAGAEAGRHAGPAAAALFWSDGFAVAAEILCSAVRRIFGALTATLLKS